jgi:hypothetical protein
VAFVIARDGTVVGAKVHEATTMPDAEVASCVAQAFRTLVFPKPEGGQATVVYPIQFSQAP